MKRSTKRKIKSFFKHNRGILFVTLISSVAFAALITLLITTGISNNSDTCESFGLKGGLDACEEDPDNPLVVYDQIVIIAGNTANSPVPSIDNKEIKKMLMGSYLLDSSTSISMISATPSAESINLGISKNQQDLTKASTLWNQTIPNSLKTSPSENGADYLNAILEAKDLVEDATNPLIMITGSGLSDSGLLNFANNANNLLHTEPSETVSTFFEIYPSKKAASKKTKVNAVWVNIGKVVEPQERLTSEQDTLKELYKSLLGEMGITLSFKATENSDTKNSVKTNGMIVKTVPISEPTDFSISFDETQIGFNGNQATFINETAAKAGLQQVVDKQNSVKKIYVKGFVALGSCGASADIELSQRRANAVKELLVEMGVPESKIIATGEGVGPYDECGADNIEEARQKNRIVIIEGEK